MIIGIGTDIVQIPRIEKILSLYPERFAKKILTEGELKKLTLLDKRNHVNFLAKRFAAKEAISKALGVGIWRGVSFKDITVSNNDLGQPLAEINLRCVYTVKSFPAFNIHLSLSDDYPVCIAFAVITAIIPVN